jgi:diguanylate cyclase
MDGRASDNRFERRLKAGEWIFREGEPGDCAFVIESGHVEITHGQDGGSETLAHLGPGEILGEMALIDGRARSASARALSDTRLRTVTSEQLAERLDSADPMLRLLLKVMLARYREVLAPGGARLLAPEDADRTAVLSRLQLEHDLALALERDEFRLHYQPIVDLRSLGLAGFEALIRWQSPQRGFVPPLTFIPVAEESELIVGIGRWVLDEGARALARLAPQGELFMNVNLSGRQLLDPDLGRAVHGAVSAAGIAPERFKLEVTESLLMNNLDRAIEVLEAQRASGVRVAIDDFGTGYSSLSYLHRLPAHTLKIDRSFVARILQDAPSRKIVAALGALARGLGMDVVAEGVENVEQARALRDMGIEYAQGYYFSRQMPEAEAVKLIGRRWSLDGA